MRYFKIVLMVLSVTSLSLWGATGATGARDSERSGLMGATGATGGYGFIGYAQVPVYGPTGPMGPTGPVVYMPMMGATGATGPMGPTGPAFYVPMMGATGATGPMGPTGPVVYMPGAADATPYTLLKDSTISIDIMRQDQAAISLLDGALSSKFPERGCIRINLAENNIGDADIPPLVALLEKASIIDRLQVLKLSNNRIGSEGLLNFSNILKKPSFQILDVSMNSFDMEAIRSLSALLEPDAERMVSADKTKENILSGWLDKVIFMPRDSDWEHVPVPKTHREAHRLYYNREAHRICS